MYNLMHTNTRMQGPEDWPWLAHQIKYMLLQIYTVHGWIRNQNEQNRNQTPGVIMYQSYPLLMNNKFI